MPIQEILVSSKQDKSKASVYRFEGVTESDAETLRRKLLTDPVTQESQVNPSWDDTFVEIGYKPGVTDPIELSLIRGANLLGITPEAASSSTRCFNKGPASLSQIQTVIKEKPSTLIHESVPKPVETISVRDLDDNALKDLSEKRSLFLNLEEMQVVRYYYAISGRDPTDVEVEMIAQTWSEHCAHKTFKAQLVDENGGIKKPLFDRIKKASLNHFSSAQVVTAFSDNAGGMRFYDGQVIIGKGETHNSPVGLDPYAGSLTKNGGLYRDIAGCGQGGSNLVGFMFNGFSAPYTEDKEVKQGSIHPKTLLMENSRGEHEYGNPMGIPTHGVRLHFHPDFGPKPTSLGVAIGIIPESMVKKGKPREGDLIVTIGGKTGRDGIHGATFSSGDMTSQTQIAHSAAVQLGDPIVEKAMFEALIVCRDSGLINAITDCGAGGYSSAIGEMANGVGAEVRLNQVPTKYSGLASWEKWLSESQERMVLAINPANWKKFKVICERYETNADVIGNFTGNNLLTIYDNGEIVGQLDLNFLHNGLPQRKMHMRHEPYPTDLREPNLPTDYTKAYKKVLSHLNIRSFEWMQRQYDMTVQGMTVMAPFVGVNQDIPSDASILAPFPDKPFGVVISYAANPTLNRVDPYWGSVWAFSHAAAKFTAAGGNIGQACGIDNFVSASPDPKTLSDLDKMTNGLCDMIDILGIPMVSGKDSLSSTYRGSDGEVIKAPSSLNVTIFGKIPDIKKTVSCDLKKPGSTICLVGKADINAMGGSAYFDTEGIINSRVPKVDIDGLVTALQTVYEGINNGKILSAKAVGEGGMGIALAQMCFGGDCGALIDVTALGASRPDFALFNETAGCLLIEVDSPEVADELFGITAYKLLGKTTEEKSIVVEGLLEADLSELKAAWQKEIR